MTLVNFYDSIIAESMKSKEKYDYLILDSFFDWKELNKFLKIPKIISTYVFPLCKQPPSIQNDSEKRQTAITKKSK